MRGGEGEEKKGGWLPTSDIQLRLFPIARHQDIAENAMLHTRHLGCPSQKDQGIGNLASVKVFMLRSKGASQRLQQDVASGRRVADGLQALSVKTSVGVDDFRGGHFLSICITCCWHGMEEKSCICCADREDVFLPVEKSTVYWNGIVNHVYKFKLKNTGR